MHTRIEIPKDIVNEIREKTDIVSIISEQVALKKAGSTLKGLCPFHQEKTPSFSVNPAKQLFYCFGCQVGGDVITFIKLQTNRPYPEIVRDLGERLGIKIPEKPLSPEQNREKEVRSRMLNVMALAHDFFMHALSKEESGVKRYVTGRGYQDAHIKACGMGFAPSAWDGLVNFLRQQKVDLELARQLGLVVQGKANEKGVGYFDRFRDRLMFPIRNEHQELVGFGGRTLTGKDAAKYLNSPETPLYKKGQVLFRLGEAKEAMRQRGFVFLVEGYFDALAFVAAGFPNVVASCGTALTLEQVKILGRYCPRIITVFDGDQAGLKATTSSIPMMAEAGVKHDVIALPQGEDPDSIWRKKGKAGVEQLAQDIVPALDFLLKKLVDHGKKGVRAKTLSVQRMAETLALLKSSVEKELWRKKAAFEFGIAEEVLDQATQPSKKPAEKTLKSLAKKSYLLPDEILLGILLHQPVYMKKLNREVIADFFLYSPLKELALRTFDDYSRLGSLNMGDLLEAFPELPKVTLRASDYAEGEVAAQAFEDCLSQLTKKQIEKSKERLLRDLRVAEKNGDKVVAQKVLGELQRVIEKQRNLT